MDLSQRQTLAGGSPCQWMELRRSFPPVPSPFHTLPAVGPSAETTECWRPTRSGRGHLRRPVAARGAYAVAAAALIPSKRPCRNSPRLTARVVPPGAVPVYAAASSRFQPPGGCERRFSCEHVESCEELFHLVGVFGQAQQVGARPLMPIVGASLIQSCLQGLDALPSSPTNASRV